MKKTILISLLILISCNKEETKVVEASKPQPHYDFSKNANSVSVKDDFSDLKKKVDESCDTEEEIKEKLVKPKQEAFKLQGGDTGCDISQLNKED